MKKYLLITGLICAATIPPATAVTKCVNFGNVDNKCSSYTTTGGADWSGVCGGTPVRGISMCSSTSGSTKGTTAGQIARSNTDTNNKYCWCRMISPAISQWVFAEAHTNNKYCLMDCNSVCMQSMYSWSYEDVRKSLLSGNLSD